MNKNVQISITGIQTAQDHQEEIVSNLTGIYYLKKDKHYIIYEEQSDNTDNSSVTKNTLIIDAREDAVVELIKKGYLHSHLSFRMSEKYASPYRTAYATFLMVVDTTSINVCVEDEHIEADIEYDLYLNDEYISHNRIIININSLETL